MKNKRYDLVFVIMLMMLVFGGIVFFGSKRIINYKNEIGQLNNTVNIYQEDTINLNNAIEEKTTEIEQRDNEITKLKENAETLQKEKDELQKQLNDIDEAIKKNEIIY